jgi:uncharacterized membrane protein
MRSSSKLAFLAVLAVLGLGLGGIAACGSDDTTPGDDTPEPGACETSYLDYTTFGEPFLLNWCAGCHSAALPATMRQNAPAGVNFDTLEGVHQFQERIAARATGPSANMPPAGGPSAEERALLVEWLSCGAK